MSLVILKHVVLSKSFLFLIIKTKMPPVRRRYVLFRIELDPINENAANFLTNEGEIVNTIRATVKQLHGEFGLGSILLNFYSKRYSPTTRTGVLVVKREAYRFLVSALPMVRTIRDQPVKMLVLKLSGTIRGCLRALQGYHGKAICDAKLKLAGDKGNKPGTHREKISKKNQKKDTTKNLNEITEGFEEIKQSLFN